MVEKPMNRERIFHALGIAVSVPYRLAQRMIPKEAWRGRDCFTAGKCYFRLQEIPVKDQK
jgi:hypothetical protein